MLRLVADAEGAPAKAPLVAGAPVDPFAAPAAVLVEEEDEETRARAASVATGRGVGAAATASGAASAAEPIPLWDVFSKLLRVAEIIKTKSSPIDTGAVFVTLPMPRSVWTPSQYFALLDAMTVDFCPTVFIRGNSRDCLTGFWDPAFSADQEGGRMDEDDVFDARITPAAVAADSGLAAMDSAAQ